MRILLLNITLALAWVALTEEFTFTNFAEGFLLAFLVLLLTQRGRAMTVYSRKFFVVLAFLLFFLWELVKANIRVTYEVLTPTHHMRPGIVAVPLDVQTDLQITLLATLITLTPGTLSLHVSADRATLYVHGMFIADREAFVRSIKRGLERRVLEVFA